MPIDPPTSEGTSDARRLGLPGLMLTDGSFIPMELSRDDALILFEWTHRFCTDTKLEFAHHAEPVVLDKISGDLERSMVEPFHADYRQKLEAARERVWAAYSARMGDDGWIAQISLRREAD